MVGKIIGQIPAEELRDVHYGRAVIKWGDACKPRVGKYSCVYYPAGWRSPTGLVTQDRAVAEEWARDIDAFLQRFDIKEIERRAA